MTESETEIDDAIIEQSLRAGIRHVTKLVGAIAAAEVVADATSDNADKRDALRDAMGKLAYRDLLPVLVSRYRTGGIVETETDQNSSVTNKYVSAVEIEKRRQMLLNDALDVVEPYLTEEEEEEFDFVSPESGQVPIQMAW